jgi:hypothetical protein
VGLGSNAVSRGGLFATAFVCLAITGLVVAITESYTSAISLQATALAVTVIAAGMGSAYSVGAGLYDMAVVAAVLLSMAVIVVAAAILTPIGMPTVLTSPILMAIVPILPILPIFSISTHAMDSFVNMA